MVEEKDRFGETMKLLERAKEDIYFAQRDRELIEKLKAQLQKVEDVGVETPLPQGPWSVRDLHFPRIRSGSLSELRRHLDG